MGISLSRSVPVILDGKNSITKSLTSPMLTHQRCPSIFHTEILFLLQYTSRTSRSYKSNN